MPTYEYRCPRGHDFERFQKMSAPAKLKCPTCGRMAVRQISGGAGLIFKGSGFYITDYGKDGKGARNDKEPAAKPEPAAAASEAAPSQADAGEQQPELPALKGKTESSEKSEKSDQSEKSAKKSSRKKGRS